jgi:hypothetical protein
LAYKKCDLKTIEVLASGTKQKTEAFCFSQKTGFCFVGDFYVLIGFLLASF